MSDLITAAGGEKGGAAMSGLVEVVARAFCAMLGLDPDEMVSGGTWVGTTPQWWLWADEAETILTAVAPLIAAREREACARLAETPVYGAGSRTSMYEIAAAIRARNAT